MTLTHDADRIDGRSPDDAHARRFCVGKRTPYERESTIDAVFARQAAATPESIALIDAAGALSYAELDAQSNRLARHLSSIGVMAGATVGVALDRSRDVPLAFLAILRASATYVPLDPSYPVARIAFILADASIDFVIVERAAATDRERYGAAVVVDLQSAFGAIGAAAAAPLPSRRRSTERAYIMYTSGSTGRPKGVAIPHRGVVRLVRGADYFVLAGGETFLQFAPAAFDASTFEIWGALLNGARLAFPPPGLLSMDELAATVERFDVTTMWLTASIFARVAEAEYAGFAGLRQMITGGSAGSPQHMRRFLALYPHCRLIAGYGPTENTTFSTAFDLTPPGAIGSNPPIGTPIANSTAYVLDADLRPLPLGEIGELYVGGDGVGLGYVNLPDLTAERFVADPFADSPDGAATLYRTGDRVRMRTDGVIEFLGRTDDQVKINGFRIELGEIEAALRSLPGVRDAAVVVVEPVPGEKLLSAHVVVSSVADGLDEGTLRAHLRAQLPVYMVPPRIALCDELPLHPSGKIDRVALAADAAVFGNRSAVTGSMPAVAGQSRSAVTQTVAAIWREVLHVDTGVEEIEMDVNFFDAGGDSLSLLTLHALLAARLRSELRIVDLFEHTTIRRIAAFIAGESR